MLYASESPDLFVSGHAQARCAPAAGRIRVCPGCSMRKKMLSGVFLASACHRKQSAVRRTTRPPLAQRVHRPGHITQWPAHLLSIYLRSLSWHSRRSSSPHISLLNFPIRPRSHMFIPLWPVFQKTTNHGRYTTMIFIPMVHMSCSHMAEYVCFVARSMSRATYCSVV